jgi:hypothetical protein
MTRAAQNELVLLNILASFTVLNLFRERGTDVEDAELSPLGKISFAIEIIDIWRAASVEQGHIAYVPTCFLLQRTLLYEATHGRQTRTSTEHDDGGGRILRRVEGSRGGTDGHEDFLADREVGEISGSDTEEFTFRIVVEGGSLDDADGESDVLGVPERGGRDGILTNAHSGEHLEVFTEGEFDGFFVLLKDVENTDPLGEEELLVVGLEVFQAGADGLILNYSEELDEVASSGRLGQLNVSSQNFQDRDFFVEGQRGRAFGRDDNLQGDADEQGIRT